jgi:hypothetical protein
MGAGYGLYIFFGTHSFGLDSTWRLSPNGSNENSTARSLMNAVEESVREA